MKTGSVNTAAPTVELAAGQGATPEGATDFVSLFTQAMTGATADGSAAASMTALGGQLGAKMGDEELAPEDLSAWIAALVGAAHTPAAVASPTEAAGALEGIAGTRELTRIVHEALNNQATAAAQEALLGTEDAQFEGVLPTSDTLDAPIDPRAAQGALDGMRDFRPSLVEAPVQRHMHSTVGTRAWADELGQQISWMTDRGQHAASLRLSPEHLGPLEIQISIQDDKASVWFGAAHADTRSAIENALPRLREMLASQGLALNDFGVFKEPPRQQPQFRTVSGDEAEVGASEEVTSVHSARLGLVDAYA